MSQYEYRKDEEELNNFLHRVNDVNNIVKKLNSKDRKIQEIGTLEADRYLNDKYEQVYEQINEETVKLTIKKDKTMINKKALLDDQKDANTLSQEAFMKEIEIDANRRFKDKQIRRERADTFKTQATKAFRRGEYEKALSLYNKAIEQIKDSCVLYINRCLTQINLGFYEKAIEDAELALKLNENSIKAWLLLAKAYYVNNNQDGFKRAVKEAKERNPKQKKFIEEYALGLEGNYKNE